VEKCDYSAPWYHGSPEDLTVLRQGSWLTQFEEMAKAFSHRPSLISFEDDDRHVKHDGRMPGFLYLVDEPIGPNDVTYLRDTAQTHWQSTRDLRVRCVAELPFDDPPQLSAEEIAALRKDHPEGSTGMICSPDDD